MTNLRAFVCAILFATLAAGCAPAPSAAQPAGSSSETTGSPSAVATPNPAATALILGDTELELDAGTYPWILARPGIDFPTIRFTVPDGWASGGRFTYRVRPEGEDPAVYMGFWDVGQLYGHPCKWQGTLFDPGPTVDDLAAAIVDIPLRNASQPIDVTLDGYAGKYIEWTVPTDIETDEQGKFVDCDTDGGKHYFESWIGAPGGWGGDRYHQGPGQVDRLWILDVDGVRFVIDANWMPSATSEEREELQDVVESILSSAEPYAGFVVRWRRRRRR